MRDERSMLEAKSVNIYCDLCADPIWSPAGNESLEDLPVTDDLKHRLQAWADIYDAYAAAEYQIPREEFDLEGFNRMGRELAEEVRAQLPDWTIRHFEESQPPC